MSGDKVVFLAFKNENLVESERGLLSCKHCRNKTFTVVYLGDEQFPSLECAACGAHLHRIGFTDGVTQ